MRVVYPDGTAISYTYDEAGNRLSQKVALLAGPPMITEISMGEGPVNSQIAIDGSGFCRTGSGNVTVQFNGVTATIISISDTEIIVTVPTGTSTGFVTVTTSAGVAKSALPFSVVPAASQVALTVSPGGADSASSVGPANDLKAGYTTLSVNSGSAPYGTAVFSYEQNGVVTSEAGVPASPPTVAARFFVDSRSGIYTPGSSGVIDISTGFALVNQGTAIANLSLRLRDSNGNTLSQGTLQLQKGEHIAKYLDQLAPGFVLPPGFASNGLGSLEVSSDQPVYVLALRLTTNQRGDFLMTTTPIADLTKPVSNNSLSFPQVADGGGYQTTLILMNTSSVIETGVVRFSTDTGAALALRLEGSGATGYQFPYSILPGGLFRLVTDGSPQNAHAGWAQVIPDSGSGSPVGAGVFGLTQAGVLITETGVPAATPTTHARIYVDMSANHDTGLAIANPGISDLQITATAYQVDGVTPAGFAPSVIDLPALGHSAEFIWQIIGELPDDFVGVLDLSSPTPFSALTMRFLTNERGDFLLTTFPIADLNQSPPTPLVFPQIADGGGYQTQFILLNPGAVSSSVTLRYLGNDGSPIAIGLDSGNTTVNPYPTSYTDFDNQTLSLYAWEGEHTVLQSRDANLDLVTVAQILDSTDRAYAYYQMATGFTPSLGKSYNGKDTISDVPTTCGAGCSYIGATGIELQNTYFDLLYNGVHNSSQFDQVVFYEFGRNFWNLRNKLEYTGSDDHGVITTGFAVFMRFMAMDAAGVNGAPFGNWSFSDFRNRVEGMIDLYLADSSQTWNSTLLQGRAQANNPSALGATDLFASFVFRLRRDYGGDVFVNNIWKEAAKRPNAATTQDAVDNFFLAACAAAQTNLTHLFTVIWHWPISASAQAAAAMFPGTQAMVSSNAANSPTQAGAILSASINTGDDQFSGWGLTMATARKRSQNPSNLDTHFSWLLQ
jgi:hypothetical protein